MSNKPQKNKTNITKISATPRNNPSDESTPTSDTTKTVSKEAELNQNTAPTHTQPDLETIKSVHQSTQTSKKAQKSIKARKSDDTEKPLKSIFIIFRPFVALGRYLRDSWRELRMVRWPNRKATWKMTLAVLVYCAIFITFIVLLDTFFTFIFKLIFGTN